ncbi:MAG TPA: DUF1707 domain-containing protein [Longimicrobiales bacterium]
MNDTPPPASSLSGRRDRTVEALCGHFASDRLTLEDFERRVDAAQRARTIAELDALLADLPSRPGPAATPAPRSAAAAPARRPTRGNAIAIFGGTSRKGPWAPPERMLAYATFGGIELDFREARLPPGVTEVTVFAFMGGIEIIVPPGLAVESEGVAILGGFDQTHDVATATAPDAPVLRIRGFVLMGGVNIQVRHPGESAHDAARRARDERRLRAAERRALRHG